MSELSRRAAELAQERVTIEPRSQADRTALEAARRTNRQLSVRRAAEFISRVVGLHVPKLPLYVAETIPGDRILMTWSQTTRHIHVGNGWVVQNREYDYDDSKEGVFLLENGDSYASWQVDQTPPEGSSIPRGPHVKAFHDKMVDRPFVPDLEAPYATDAGLEMLARALADYQQNPNRYV